MRHSKRAKTGSSLPFFKNPSSQSISRALLFEIPNNNNNNNNSVETASFATDKLLVVSYVRIRCGILLKKTASRLVRRREPEVENDDSDEILRQRQLSATATAAT